MKKDDKDFFDKYSDSTVLVRFTAKELYYFSIGVFSGDMKEFFKVTWEELKKKRDTE